MYLIKATKKQIANPARVSCGNWEFPDFSQRTRWNTSLCFYRETYPLFPYIYIYIYIYPYPTNGSGAVVEFFHHQHEPTRPLYLPKLPWDTDTGLPRHSFRTCCFPRRFPWRHPAQPPQGNAQPCKPGKGQDKYDVYGTTRLPTSSLQALLFQSVPVNHSMPSHPPAMLKGAHFLSLEALLKRSRCESSRGRSFKP